MSRTYHSSTFYLATAYRRDLPDILKGDIPLFTNLRRACGSYTDGSSSTRILPRFPDGGAEMPSSTVRSFSDVMITRQRSDREQCR